MLRKRRFLIGGIIILLAIGSLSIMAFKGAATYYYSVGEVIGQGEAMYGENIRVAGQVAPGSVIQENSVSNTLKFILMDTNSTDKQLPVVYTGGVPDAFKENNEAVVEGSLSSSGIFEAQLIIVKCPSKYVPEE